MHVSCPTKAKRPRWSVVSEITRNLTDLTSTVGQRKK